MAKTKQALKSVLAFFANYFTKILFFILFPLSAYSQPIDLIIPDESINASLSKELRTIQAIERDLSLEKLTHNKTKLDALIELGELRLSQGKLEEAERFFKMVLEKSPNNMRANKGLAMVYYNQGKFKETKEIYEKLTQLYPLSEALQKELQKVRSKINSEADIGIRIFEDSRNYLEIISFIELFYPSFKFPKLSCSYRLESWSYEENNSKLYSRVIAGTFNYALSEKTSIDITYAPETFTDSNTTISNYLANLISGNNSIKTIVSYGKLSYKDNIQTAKSHLTHETGTLALLGTINERTKISQSISASDINDGNSQRKFETSLMHLIKYNGDPLISVELKLTNLNFEQQLDKNGMPLPYWAPSDFRSGTLKLNYDRQVGEKWFWGLSPEIIRFTYKSLSTDSTTKELSFGYYLHASYKFETGRFHIEYGDSYINYYRQRKLGVYTSINF